MVEGQQGQVPDGSARARDGAHDSGQARARDPARGHRAERAAVRRGARARLDRRARSRARRFAPVRREAALRRRGEPEDLQLAARAEPAHPGAPDPLDGAGGRLESAHRGGRARLRGAGASRAQESPAPAAARAARRRAACGDLRVPAVALRPHAAAGQGAADHGRGAALQRLARAEHGSLYAPADGGVVRVLRRSAPRLGAAARLCLARHLVAVRQSAQPAAARRDVRRRLPFPGAALPPLPASNHRAGGAGLRQAPAGVLMHALPLLRHDPPAVFACRDGLRVTAPEFLADPTRLPVALPERPYVGNLFSYRYRFAVGLAAALLRRQTTLMPPNQTPDFLERLQRAYADLYRLTDDLLDAAAAAAAKAPGAGPRVPADQLAALLV